MRISTFLLSPFLAVTLVSTAHADPVTLVNTGPSGPAGQWNADWQDQWLAARFPVTRTATITTAEGWAIPWGPDATGAPRFGGPVRLALLNDAGGLPGSVLFSTVTNIPGAGPAQWIGASALSWSVHPGDYWLSFEPLSHEMSGPAFSGTMFTMGGSTAAPLSREARAILQSECNFRDRGCWQWELASDLDLGVRVFADAASPMSTPEPLPVVQLAVAALIYGAIVRRKRLIRWRHANG